MNTFTNYTCKLHRRIILTIFLLCAFFISCGSLPKKQDVWEGFKNGKLRVIVNYSPDYDEFGNDTLITQRLLHTAKSRTALILVSYVRLNYPDLLQTESANQIVQKTEEVIESVKLIFKFEDSDTFRGIYETDANILIDFLISISTHNTNN